jgi:MoxR-like ATPase
MTAVLREATSGDSVVPRDVRPLLGKLEATIATAVRGKNPQIRLALATLAARGHLLIEDVPGVGKTTLARALARSVGGTFRRIQFTSDLLPSDILGVNVYNDETHHFEFHPGPIFANVVLADEINRTTPRTQSSLLEAMSEGRVSIDNTTHEIPQPFIVVATQNPLEHFGTYPLPESQMDRFLVRMRLGYPSAADERDVVLASGASVDPVDAISAVISPVELAHVQDAAARVTVENALLDYAQTVVAETRKSPFLRLGVSPRGFQGWFRIARARALIEGRAFAVPDDFKDTAVAALSHRVLLVAGGSEPGRNREDAERVIAELLERVPVPT